MSIEIKSIDEFNILLKTLILDLTEVKTQFEFYCDLVYAGSTYGREMNQAPLFWTFIQRALLDASLVGLFKIYDQNTKALSLHNLIDTIGENLHLFNVSIDKTQLEEYKKYIGEQNETVKRLFIWRHNLLGHRNAKDIIKQRNVTSQHRLTNDDISDLIKGAESILNYYSRIFQDVTTSMQLFGSDDYTFVLLCRQ